jgi:hypothetical protein
MEEGGCKGMHLLAAVAANYPEEEDEVGLDEAMSPTAQNDMSGCEWSDADYP